MLLNRSFSRRIGKSLSQLQKDLLEQNLPHHLFSVEKVESVSASKEIILEIGFGMGEHFVHQTALNPDKLFIGAEVYLNGVANVLKLAEKSSLPNFLIWPNDLDLIQKDLPDQILSGIYILFPDPWPKRRQKKKRIFNTERLTILKQKLKAGGFIIFASDIVDYFEQSLELISNDVNFAVEIIPHHLNYLKTKYHQKAEKENRHAQFLQAIKLC
jgi:release factor glutamine methyltransferase